MADDSRDVSESKGSCMPARQRSSPLQGRRCRVLAKLFNDDLSLGCLQGMFPGGVSLCSSADAFSAPLAALIAMSTEFRLGLS